MRKQMTDEDANHVRLLAHDLLAHLMDAGQWSHLAIIKIQIDRIIEDHPEILKALHKAEAVK
jgi:hypothetical protein